jgi:hypothetical protein
MKQPRKVLSIDVGIKNLSYCSFIVEDTISILDWQNIMVTDRCIKKIPFQEITELMLSTLEEHFDDTTMYDYVIIENQPMLRNGLMKTVSVMIYTYFCMLKMHHGNIGDVKFVSASNKLKGTELKQNTYKDRKKSSIELANLHIAQYCPNLHSWFLRQPKKDDCADSLNQGIAFIRKNFANIR